MPNHVKNILVISGTKEDIAELKNLVFNEKDNTAFCFDKIIPKPPENEINFDDNKISEYLPLWYQWCTLNWGTKWNCYESEMTDFGDNNVHYSFLTAWSSPIPVILTLSKKFPKIKFILQYADEDLGNNVGYLEFEDGKIIKEFFPEGNEAFEMGMKLWGMENYYKLVDGKYIYDEEN